MTFSDYFEDRLLGYTLCRSTGLSFVQTVYVSLISTLQATDLTSYTEVCCLTANASVAGYVRPVIAFGAPSGGVVANTQSTFPVAILDWGTAPYIGIFDSQTFGGGNLLYWGTLATTQTIRSGGTFQISSGQLTVTLQ